MWYMCSCAFAPCVADVSGSPSEVLTEINLISGSDKIDQVQCPTVRCEIGTVRLQACVLHAQVGSTCGRYVVAWVERTGIPCRK